MFELGHPHDTIKCVYSEGKTYFKTSQNEQFCWKKWCVTGIRKTVSTSKLKTPIS